MMYALCITPAVPAVSVKQKSTLQYNFMIESVFKVLLFLNSLGNCHSKNFSQYQYINFL
jgi:hypothetical protein